MTILDGEAASYREAQDRKHGERKDKDAMWEKDTKGLASPPTKGPPASDSTDRTTSRRDKKDADEKWARKEMPQPTAAEVADAAAASAAAAASLALSKVPLPPKVSQIIMVPSSLVGLLLIKNVKAKRLSALNQIQDMTCTVISKVP
jgi:hypothetical protein